MGLDVRLPRPEALIGRFHATVAERLEELLYRRGITVTRVDRDDDVALYVDPDVRDDLRAELALTWATVVHSLPEESAREVLALGGAAPGWHDAPRGGWVDRSGRLVVDTEDHEVAADTARVAGPALLGAGAVVLLLGWYVGAPPGVMVVGVALALLGVLLPR